MDNTKDKNLGEESREVTDISHKNVDPQSDLLGFFQEDGNFVFAYKKTEKLVTAIYLVTNLLSDNEPVKWTLRKKAGYLLSFMLGLKDTFFSRRIDFIHTAKHNVLELVSLLQISSRGGLISEMNYSILKQEFSNLVSAIESPGASTHNPLLPRGFFDTERNQDKNVQKTAGLDMKEHGQEPTSRERDSALKLEHSSTLSPKAKRASPDAHVVKRSNRQNTILNLLRKKAHLTVKDIAEVIQDCSEKTIQRELISFISAGVVKRAGERRWSRYSLV